MSRIVMPDFHILRALILAVALSACGGPPETIVDPPVPPGEFVWQSGFTDLDEAVLSTCGHNGEFLAVGGDQQAAVLEWLDGEWRVAPMPAGAGVLWWCWIDSAGAAWAVGERGHRANSYRWTVEPARYPGRDFIRDHPVRRLGRSSRQRVRGGRLADQQHPTCGHRSLRRHPSGLQSPLTACPRSRCSRSGA